MVELVAIGPLAVDRLAAMNWQLEVHRLDCLSRLREYAS